MSKTALQTSAYTFALGVTVILVGILSQGQYFRKVIPMASAIIFAGLASSLALVMKGQKADQECDERVNRIQEKSMKFAFFSMSVVLVAFWSYNVAITGKFTNEMTYLLYALFGSFYIAYLFYKFRL
ncbi:MAG: hypothetical protein ACYCX4_15430 [Bacillota bacterium]